MSAARDRKEAAKRIGLELRKRYSNLVTAGNDPNDVQIAAIELGALFNENIEFVIWALLTFGGMDNIPLPERKPQPANDLPKMPEIFSGKPN